MSSQNSEARLEWLAAQGEPNREWFASARKPRLSRDGGMRTRGPVGKVTVSYHRPTRDRLRRAAAQRDAALRAARESS